jgi:outer membrane receptor protein involved in Fe transport
METVSYFSDNISISTPMNIGSSRKTGIELNGKYSPLKWFSVTGDFNFGYFNPQ